MRFVHCRSLGKSLGPLEGLKFGEWAEVGKKNPHFIRSYPESVSRFQSNLVEIIPRGLGSKAFHIGHVGLGWGGGGGAGTDHQG